MFHEPVMPDACIQGLNIRPGGDYVDLTHGGGGHSGRILDHLETGRLMAFDKDEDAGKKAMKDKRFIFIHQDFRFMKNFLMLYHMIPVDGILADLGISSHQIDTAERGFSTRHDGTLDMRMDRRQKLTARDILETYAEEKLKMIFGMYGEVRNAGTLARTVSEARKSHDISTVSGFTRAISACIPKGSENRYMAQVFQALRIEVNGELEALKLVLEQAAEVIKPGGRLVVISYHSLEDRLVKNFMRSGRADGLMEKDFYGNTSSPWVLVERKALTPAPGEVAANPRARSAKLRIAERV